MKMQEKMTIHIALKLDITLWQIIKFRLLGLSSPTRRKVTIQELIDRDRA